MKKRDLPEATISTRPGLRTHVGVNAFNRWNPDVHAAGDEKEPDNTISIMDVIGSDWFGEGVTLKRVSAALRSIGDRDVVVNINSPGGDYFEGLAIYNAFRMHSAKVTTRVLGLAASAASVIAMAGDEVQVARAGFLMIHNTWVVAMGDQHVLRDVADWLDPFDAQAADIYAARTGLDEKEVRKMLDRETWISGADAVAKGFADSLLPSDATTSAKASGEGKAVHAKRKVDSLLATLDIPRSERRALLAAIQSGKPSAVDPSMQDAALEREVYSLLATVRAM